MFISQCAAKWSIIEMGIKSASNRQKYGNKNMCIEEVNSEFYDSRMSWHREMIIYDRMTNTHTYRIASFYFYREHFPTLRFLADDADGDRAIFCSDWQIWNQADLIDDINKF